MIRGYKNKFRFGARCLVTYLSILLFLPTFVCTTADGHSHATNWLFHQFEEIAVALHEADHDHKHEHEAEDYHHHRHDHEEDSQQEEQYGPFAESQHSHDYSDNSYLKSEQVPTEDPTSLRITWVSAELSGNSLAPDARSIRHALSNRLLGVIPLRRTIVLIV